MYQKLFIFIIVFPFTNGHIVGDKAYLSQLKQMCEHAYSCFHDNVMVCGKSVQEQRTFLDLCDLYEFSCEKAMVYQHVKDEPGQCPDPRHLAQG